MKRNQDKISRQEFQKAAEMVFQLELAKAMEDTGWTEKQYLDWFMYGIDPETGEPSMRFVD